MVLREPVNRLDCGEVPQIIKWLVVTSFLQGFWEGGVSSEDSGRVMGTVARSWRHIDNPALPRLQECPLACCHDSFPLLSLCIVKHRPVWNSVLSGGIINSLSIFLLTTQWPSLRWRGKGFLGTWTVPGRQAFSAHEGVFWADDRSLETCCFPGSLLPWSMGDPVLGQPD